MDAAIILAIALFYLIRCLGQPVVKVPQAEKEDAKRIAKTNDTYYKDESAFTSISKALGFPKEST